MFSPNRVHLFYHEASAALWTLIPQSDGAFEVHHYITSLRQPRPFILSADAPALRKMLHSPDYTYFTAPMPR